MQMEINLVNLTNFGFEAIQFDHPKMIKRKGLDNKSQNPMNRRHASTITGLYQSR